MLKKIGWATLGMGVGVLANKTYAHYNPQKNITLSSKEMIDSYIKQRKLQTWHYTAVLKALGIMFKGFYSYGMNVKLEGFNFNTTYLLDQEIKNDNQINHIYCIFSPNEYLCGHPQIQHGGATATLIDQNFGYLAILNSKTNIATASLTMNYKRPVKKDQLYVFEGKVKRREGRKIYMQGVIKQLETGQIKVETESLFLTVNWDNQMSRIIKKFFQFDEDILHHHHRQPQQTNSNAPSTSS